MVFEILMVCLVIAIPVVALLSTSILMSITGNIVGVGVSVNPTSVNFGSIDRGSVTNTNVVITNTGNLNEALSMTVSGLPSYLALSWNCTGITITPSMPVTAMFTLSASQSAPFGSFNFNITVSGTQAP